MSFHDVHSTLNTCERTVLESFEGGVDQTYLQQLGQLPFFHPVNLTELFAEGRVLNVNKHGIVFLQGEVGNFAFVVLRGSVDLYYQSDEHVEVALRSHLGAIMNDKRDLVPIESFRHLLGKTLCCLQVGEVFGDFSLLSNEFLSNRRLSRHQQNLFESPRGNSKHVLNQRSPMQHKVEVADRGAGAGTRSCSAVVSADGALLLAIHEGTYRRLIREHRARQAELVQTALSLRSCLPVLQQASFATVLQAATQADRQRLSYSTLLASYGAPISTVFVLLAGEVRVYGPSVLQQQQRSAGSASLFGSGSDGGCDCSCSMQSPSVASAAVDGSVGVRSITEGSSWLASPRIPQASVGVLRPGEVVGGLEVRKGLSHFKYNYEVQTLHAELLALPHDAYLRLLRDWLFCRASAAERNRTVLSAADRVAMRAQRAASLAEIQALCVLWQESKGIVANSRRTLASGSVGAFDSLDSVSAGLLQDFSGVVCVSPTGAKASARRAPAPSALLVASPPVASSRPSNLGAVWAGQHTSTSQPHRHYCKSSKSKPPCGATSPRPADHPSPRPSGNIISRSRSPRGQGSPRRSPNQKSEAGTQAATPRCKPACSAPGAEERAAAVEEKEELHALLALPADVKGAASASAGPNPCLEYAVTPAEAAQRVQEELRAIRSRLRAKQQGQQQLTAQEVETVCRSISLY